MPLLLLLLALGYRLFHFHCFLLHLCPHHYHLHCMMFLMIL
uniref:Uncharacterized protein n=1 Tax=Arundo donax TaxID=35708 RepID=A0A0A8Z167_ARUDO